MISKQCSFYIRKCCARVPNTCTNLLLYLHETGTLSIWPCLSDIALVQGCYLFHLFINFISFNTKTLQIEQLAQYFPNKYSNPELKSNQTKIELFICNNKIHAVSIKNQCPDLQGKCSSADELLAMISSSIVFNESILKYKECIQIFLQQTKMKQRQVQHAAFSLNRHMSKNICVLFL